VPEFSQLADPFFDWIEEHAGLAAWVQAVGVITTLSVAIYFSRLDVVRKRAAERRRASALFYYLQSTLDDFQAKIIAAENAPREATTLQLPNRIARRARDFQLLEGARNQLSTLQDQLSELNQAISGLRDSTTAEADVRKAASDCHRTLALMIDELKAPSS
jgi:hypothetical protein